MLKLRWTGPHPNDCLHPQLRRYCQVYQAEVEDGHLTVIVGKEPQGWHLSISHRLNLMDPQGHPIPGRLPSWEELKAARYRFVPDEVCMAQVLPPRAKYLNHHPTTLHLWECPMELAER